MKATLEFDMENYDDKREHARMIKATDAFIALEDIANDVFRPARKHMYNDEKLNNLIRKCGEDGFEIISILEDMFYEIRNKYAIIDMLD